MVGYSICSKWGGGGQGAADGWQGRSWSEALKVGWAAQGGPLASSSPAAVCCLSKQHRLAAHLQPQVGDRKGGQRHLEGVSCGGGGKREGGGE